MVRFSLALAVVAIVAAVLPGGMYIGMGAGSFAATCGLMIYKTHGLQSWSRLSGALAATVGIAALLIAAGRFTATYWAVSRMTQMLS
ncbi:MAG: hypothetical protein JKY56_20080 [Kofleriaceae bacterium]|nr:hypothetical protein [Kofleriaceae bacterium]